MPMKFSQQDFPDSVKILRGNWQISDLSLLKINQLGKKGVATDFGYSSALKIGADIPLKANEGVRLNLTYERTVLTFMTYGFNFHYGASDYIQSDYNFETNRYDTTYVSKKYPGLDLAVGVQLPIKVSQIYLIPRINGFYGLNFGGEEIGGAYYGYSIGLEAAYKLQRKNYLFAGVGYKQKLIPKFFSENSLVVNKHGVPYLQAYVRISF